MKRPDAITLDSGPAGNDFESSLIDIIRTHFLKEKTQQLTRDKYSLGDIDIMYKKINNEIKTNVINCINTDEDKFNGTDCISYGTRIDFTLNFNGKFEKDFVPFAYDTKIPAFLDETFKIAIKHGNSHSDFDTPVIIIGANIDGSTYTHNNNIIKENFEKKR